MSYKCACSLVARTYMRNFYLSQALQHKDLATLQRARLVKAIPELALTQRLALGPSLSRPHSILLRSDETVVSKHQPLQVPGNKVSSGIFYHSGLVVTAWPQRFQCNHEYLLGDGPAKARHKAPKELGNLGALFRHLPQWKCDKRRYQ